MVRRSRLHPAPLPDVVSAQIPVPRCFHSEITEDGTDFALLLADYRLGVVQAPLITGLGFAFAASTERGDEMILTMLHRGCRAIRELETLELINSSQSI